MQNLLPFHSIQITETFLLVVMNAGILCAQPEDRLVQDMTIDAGYLFVNGVYIEAPYKLEFNENVLRINGTDYTETDFDLSEYANHGRGEGGRGGGRGRQGAGPGRGGRGGPRGEVPTSPFGRVYRELESLNDGTVVLFELAHVPMFLSPRDRGHDFLEFLLSTAEGNQVVSVPEGAGDEAHREIWRQVASGFSPPAEFLRRAKPQVDTRNAARLKTETEFAAIKFSRRINYPLTMFAMVLVVFAAGHLMTIAQPTFAVNADASETSTSNAIRSLTIVALLSAIDLIWTIMAHQSGSMREMNPLGARLISDPIRLLAFKVSLTGLAIFLLFWLRGLPLTRKATWWCCLVLTLLTARWLTFHSMFA